MPVRSSATNGPPRFTRDRALGSCLSSRTLIWNGSRIEQDRATVRDEKYPPNRISAPRPTLSWQHLEKTIRSSALDCWTLHVPLDVITKVGRPDLSRRSLDRITKRSHDERFCPDRIFECLDLYEATGTPFARDTIRSAEEFEEVGVDDRERDQSWRLR